MFAARLIFLLGCMDFYASMYGWCVINKTPLGPEKFIVGYSVSGVRKM